MRRYVTFLWCDCFRLSFVGYWRYHLWMTCLTLVALGGVYAWSHQFVHGLVTTGMTDQVSYADAHNNLAWLYYTRGANLDHAERLATQAIDLNPSKAPIYRDTLEKIRQKKESAQGH